MGSSLECPYCEEELDDPDDCYKEDEVYEHSCRHCEQNFTFTLSYSVYYESEKADCLNGGEHDWKPINGSPAEYFVNKRRCSMCDRQMTIKKDDQA